MIWMVVIDAVDTFNSIVTVDAFDAVVFVETLAFY